MCGGWGMSASVCGCVCHDVHDFVSDVVDNTVGNVHIVVVHVCVCVW